MRQRNQISRRSHMEGVFFVCWVVCFFFLKHPPPPISHPKLPPPMQKWPMTQKPQAGENRAHLCPQPPTKGIDRHISHRTVPGGLLEGLQAKPVLKCLSLHRGSKQATRFTRPGAQSCPYGRAAAPCCPAVGQGPPLPSANAPPSQSQGQAGGLTSCER